MDMMKRVSALVALLLLLAPGLAAAQTELNLGNVPVSASNPLPVAQTGALPAGGNVIGGVTQSGTWNIGSITSLPNITIGAALPAGTNSIGTVVLGAGSAAVGSVTVTTSALPSGAATAANQTVDQSTAGTPATTVESVQGNAAGVPLPASISQNTVASTAFAFGLAAATTATQMASHSSLEGVSVKADQKNTNPICIGFSSAVTTNTSFTTTTGYCLYPGEAHTWLVANSNQLWEIGTTTTDGIYVTGN